MSNMLTQMVADHHTWIKKLSLLRQAIIKITGISGIFVAGYESGWKAAQETFEGVKTHHATAKGMQAQKDAPTTV